MMSRLAPLLLAAGAAGTKPSVVHVVIDDLGYYDMQFRNHQTKTPVMDGMVSEGIEVKEFYVYKMCAPSRASVLTGRYPFNVGYYNNNGGAKVNGTSLPGGVDLRFKMLPELLKPAGYDTHALGKWHVGWTFKNYTPTYRGFDSFLGSSGNTGDYFYHLHDSNDCPSTPTPHGAAMFDLVDATEPRGMVPPADMKKYNGTYDARLLTDRAVEIIKAKPKTTPFYMYLAYHNVHVPIQAPLETVQEFPTVTSDARKVADAMLLEVDNGVGRISKALQEQGRYNNTLFIVHTDNGGPGSHACNYPLRGGKFTFWEGGVRGLGFFFSPLFPAAVRGTEFNGLAHIADIYLTVAEGVAGLKVDVASTGPIPPDSHNLWPALMGGEASPREDVIHLPFSNKYTNTSDCGKKAPNQGCSPSMRLGKYKIVYGWPGEDQIIYLPPLSDHNIPYGKSGGTVREGNQALGPHWKGYNTTNQSNTCVPYCVFDVSVDIAETKDLSGDASVQSVVAEMSKRLQAAADAGPPECAITDSATWHHLKPAECVPVQQTGAWLPLDWNGTMPNPPPAPPKPTCDEEALEKLCPHSKYPVSPSKECRECCRENKDNLPNCKPKDFSAYCA